MKKYIFILIFACLVPSAVVASFTTNLHYGKEERPKSCPGTLRHNIKYLGEGAHTALVTPFSANAAVSRSMFNAQNRVNEAEHCELTEKQAEKTAANYEKQYQRVEKKVEKTKNKNELTTKITEQNLAQTKKLAEISEKTPKKASLSQKMIAGGNKSTMKIIEKNQKDKVVIFQEKSAQIKKTAKEKFAPSAPKAPTQNTQGKTEAQIREEEDCLPGETLEQCMEENWDGKYFSAEEYERANGLR